MVDKAAPSGFLLRRYQCHFLCADLVFLFTKRDRADGEWRFLASVSVSRFRAKLRWPDYDCFGSASHRAGCNINSNVDRASNRCGVWFDIFGRKNWGDQLGRDRHFDDWHLVDVVKETRRLGSDLGIGSGCVFVTLNHIEIGKGRRFTAVLT